jgi:hypothetical protein
MACFPGDAILEGGHVGVLEWVWSGTGGGGVLPQLRDDSKQHVNLKYNIKETYHLSWK